MWQRFYFTIEPQEIHKKCRNFSIKNILSFTCRQKKGKIRVTDYAIPDYSFIYSFSGGANDERNKGQSLFSVL